MDIDMCYTAVNVIFNTRKFSKNTALYHKETNAHKYYHTVKYLFRFNRCIL